MKPLSILVADDHPLFRQGLRQTIETEPAFRVSREVGDGYPALEAIRELKPDLCILDVNMPAMDGLTVVRQMQAQHLRTKVIILTMYKEKDLLNTAIDLGVKAYVLKESAVTDILDAIRAILAGHHYISPGLSEFLFARQAGAESLRQERPGLERLTRTEHHILQLIAQDRTSKEIADELSLSPRTVENHRTNICAKLDVHGIHSLVKFAYANKSRL
jgi:DNA-binding NarL/FixJ family response regulator